MAIAELSLAKRTEHFLGADVAVKEGAVALSYRPKGSANGGLQLLSISGRSIEPARVVGQDLTPAERFEASFPGFLASKGPGAIRSWQLCALVYEHLVERGLAPPFSLLSFASLHPKKKIDPEHSNLVSEAAAYIRFAIGSTPAIERLTELRHDHGGYSLTFELYPFFDGEDDTFAITDLRGIDRCTALEHVRLYLGEQDGPPVDVAPLAALPRLETLELSGRVKGVAKLADARALRSLRFAAEVEAEELRTLREKRPDLEITRV